MLKSNLVWECFSADASINVTLCLDVCIGALECALKTHLGGSFVSSILGRFFRVG